MSCIGLVLAAVLVWLLQCGLYNRWWQRGFSVSVAFSQESAVEGEDAALDEVITNAKDFPIPALHVKFQIGRELVFLNQENSKITDQNYRSDIFSCMPWQQVRRHLKFHCGKRGLYTIRQVDLATYDFLWSSQFVASVPVESSMYVYPAFVDPLRLSLPLRQLTDAMAARGALLRDPFDLRSIRDYTRNDPYRDINWKATARTGCLKVNVHAPATSWRVTLLLDGDSDRIWEDWDLKEETVRLAATLSERLATRGIPVSVCSNAKDCVTHEELFIAHGFGKAHIRAILELLARADLEGEGRRPMEEVVGELESLRCGEAWPGTGFYVLLSPCQREKLAKAYARLCQCSPGSQWILPLRRGDAVRLDVSEPLLLDQFYPWEVAI